MVIRTAIPADIDAILACERQPGYEDVVGRWSREQHDAGMADATHRYLVALAEDQAVAGYLMMQRAIPSSESVLIKRIAVLHPGSGIGRALLQHALAVIFNELAAEKVTLTVRPHNQRGLKLYRGLGLTDDGVETFLRDGQPAFNLVLSMHAQAYRNRPAVP